MHLKSISEWLSWIKTLHPQAMDLSLERVAEIAKRLDLLKPHCPVITVAGTNGKGSCVAGFEAVYLAAGYRVGAFTSPYLFRYNEQVRLQGKEVEDAVFCKAFAKIAEVLKGITLTLFEFNTLAALEIFKQEKLDILILEVGLGGRWDAVNVVEAEVAVVTTIALDHTDKLGNTREAIAFEKAGIFRAGKSAICGDFQPPLTLRNYADEIKAPLFLQNEHFGFHQEIQQWYWWSKKNRLEHLPLPKLALQNMSTVLMAVELLQEKLPVSRSAVDQAFRQVKLPGRIQVIPGKVEIIFDVSHNPAAVERLANYLEKQLCQGKTLAVFSMLADKDILSSLRMIKERIDHWYSAPLITERGASLAVLSDCFHKADIENVTYYSTIDSAYHAALYAATTQDRIVVFGSFHTVSSVSAIRVSKRDLCPYKE